MDHVEIVDGQHTHGIDGRVNIATIFIIEVYEGCIQHGVATWDRMRNLSCILSSFIDHRPIDAFKESNLGWI